MKRIFGLALAALLTLSACNRSPALPNPVESKDGVSYIPIDDTAFLIPDKTWLTGVSRKATDGTVGHIGLHATVPDVQPWSKARHDEMYWPAGPGKKLVIRIEGGNADNHVHFHEVPHSREWVNQFIEEPSEQAAQGLRRFRKSWGAYSEEDAKEGLKKFGPEHVERRRKNANKPMMDTIYYELIENDRVKFFMRCHASTGGLPEDCHLNYPWGKTLMIDVYFMGNDIGHIVSMADKLSDKLREFEAAGLAYRAMHLQSQQSQPSRP